MGSLFSSPAENIYESRKGRDKQVAFLEMQLREKIKTNFYQELNPGTIIGTHPPSRELPHKFYLQSQERTGYNYELTFDVLFS